MLRKIPAPVLNVSVDIELATSSVSNICKLCADCVGARRIEGEELADTHKPEPSPECCQSAHSLRNCRSVLFSA